MRFEITRASISAFAEDNPKPCEEAYAVPVENDDYLREYIWYVDINTLEELIAFNNKCEHSLVFDARFDPDIKIYDDYLD